MALFGKKEKAQPPDQTQAPTTPAPETQKPTRLQAAQTALDQARLVRDEVQKAINDARSESRTHWQTIQTCNQKLAQATTAEEIRSLIAEQEKAKREREALEAVINRLEANLREQENRVKSAEMDLERVQGEAMRARHHIKNRKATIADFDRQIAEAKHHIEVLKSNQDRERNYLQGQVEHLLELTGETAE